MRRAPLAILIVALAAAGQGPAAAAFVAAAGKLDITPTRSVYIAGYGANRRSEGVHDPLWARCLVMRSGDQALALVCCDLLGLTRRHVLEIRRLVRSVPAERVLVGVTHTHSGPDTYGQWGPSPTESGVDRAWMADLVRRIAALVDETAGRLRPATVRFGTREDVEDCSYNARVAEILDTELGAVQVVDAAGKTVATLVNYACHPEVLDNHQITSDFPHWLRQRVEERLGGVAIYANGAQGGMVTALIHNESGFPKGEAWPEAERIGRALGEAALAALDGAAEVRDPAITFARRVYKVPMGNAAFRALMEAGVLPNDLNPDGTITTEVVRFTVGSSEWLTLPGEVLPNIGLRLKRKMAGTPRFLLGLTGDALGYILTPEDYGLKLYAYETRVSVGEQMGALMESNLLAMMPGAARR